MGPFSPRIVSGGTTVPGLADRVVLELLEALTRVDLTIRRWYASRGRPLPLLYASGVRYVREDYSGTFPEDWQDVLELYRTRRGDCEDLACARAAELREAGEPARAVFVARRRPEGGRLIHILVRRADGTIEDPSKILGMTGEG